MQAVLLEFSDASEAIIEVDEQWSRDRSPLISTPPCFISFINFLKAPLQCVAHEAAMDTSQYIIVTTVLWMIHKASFRSCLIEPTTTRFPDYTCTCNNKNLLTYP